MKNEKKIRVGILGSTGSIGRQTLEVIALHSEIFEVEFLTANSQAELLIEQAKSFHPNAVVIADESKYELVKAALNKENIKVFTGRKSVEQIAATDSDIVLAALVGFAGLAPCLSAIRAGKTIALANKETLVVAGALMTAESKHYGVNLLPVDSEHSAIFQCLAGEWNNPLEKIILTASGGPFRGLKKSELDLVTPERALKHPNWTMGKKVTIDSASLMNKGLEVIEAHWLFNLPPEKIEVLVHPQSIIHSMVQFEDGSMKAQLGLPDMKLPIQYALAYPNRLKSEFPRLDFAQQNSHTFEIPDFTSFPNLQLAYDAIKWGGSAPCILNAANEIAVESFLKNEIRFTDMPVIIEQCLEMEMKQKKYSLEELIAIDSEVRIKAGEVVRKIKK